MLLAQRGSLCLTACPIEPRGILPYSFAGPIPAGPNRLESSTVKSLITQATAHQEKHRWFLAPVNPDLKFIVESTNSPEIAETWKMPKGSRLGLDTDRSRLVAVSFSNPDCKKRLEETIGLEIPKNVGHMTGDTLIMRLPKGQTESPTSAYIAPGTLLSSADGPLLIPEDMQLDWLSNPLEIAKIAYCPPSIMRLVKPSDMTRNRWTKLI